MGVWENRGTGVWENRGMGVWENRGMGECCTAHSSYSQGIQNGWYSCLSSHLLAKSKPIFSIYCKHQWEWE